MGHAGLHGRTKEVGVGNAGNFHGVLECQEESRPAAFVNAHVQQVLSVQPGFPLRYLIVRMSAKNFG